MTNHTPPTEDRDWKVCRQCKERKPMGEFYRKPTLRDGHHTYCKVCYRKYDLMRNRRNPEKRAASFKGVYEKYKERIIVQTRQRYQRIKDSQEHKARVAMKKAIATGELVRQPCEVCGEKKVQGHHPDYSKPLDVRWLCSKHHGEVHRKFKTEDLEQQYVSHNQPLT